MTGYTIRPLHKDTIVFELVDDGGEVVAVGYEGPLSLIIDKAQQGAGPCACGKAHGAPLPLVTGRNAGEPCSHRTCTDPTCPDACHR